MRFDISQQLRTEMRLRMAPRMIQSMEILQLPLMALQERIDQEMIENPVLEDLTLSDRPTQIDPDDPGPGTDTIEPPEPSELEQDQREEWDDLLETPRASRAALAEESDRKHDAMQNMADRPPSLQEDLSLQIGFLDLDPTERALADYIINNLDENGYFNLELPDVVRDFEGHATIPQAERALACVQSLDPPGIAARDLRECLLRQLTPEIPHRDVLEALISNHLDDLQQNRLPLIEKRTGFPIATIKEAIEELRHLNPRPGLSYAPDSNRYVVPDVIAEPDDHGRYVVRLADDRMPRLGISRRYQRMLKHRSGDPEARAFLQKKIQSARWLIESIEQRRNTLLKVAQAIVDHQQDFLDRGPESIQPLKMQQIADLVGVHVTTVSRAVDDKWIQTPRGIYPLKRFFGGGTTTASGEEVAWDTIKQKLLEVIAKEDKKNPLSDDEIVKELGREGLPVARRTVSKYRKTLKIPSSRQRREF